MAMNRSFAICVVLCVVLLAGCSYAPRGDTVHVNYYGSINSSSEFHMEGHLASEGGSPEQDVFKDVTLQLYSAEGDLVASDQLGDLQADHGRLNVSITEETIPKYVVFVSPDFWREPMSVPYFTRQDEEYVLHEATSKDELPVTA